MMSDEMWNSVWLLGPQREIDRLKALCIDMDPETGRGDYLDFASVPLRAGDPLGSSWWAHGGENGEAWNFRDWPAMDRGEYKFTFDTTPGFPKAVIERLAELFPAVSFYCTCIANDDRSRGFGWFNAPAGGVPFRDDYRVPKGYWSAPLPRASSIEGRQLSLISELRAKVATM